MPSPLRRALRLLLSALVPAIAACHPAPPAEHAAVAVHDDDACAVCGMYLGDAAGPRAQAFLRGEDRPHVFDSTRDFFAWTTQPEHAARLGALYVQDVARIDWRHPDGAAASFIPARDAWYVAWQSRHGAMGPTFAPFATRPAAEAFRARYGGAILRHAEIDAALVATLSDRCPPATAGQSSCLAPAPTPADEPPATTPALSPHAH